MKLIDALQNVNKSKEFKTSILSNFIQNEFDVDIYDYAFNQENWYEQERLTCYFLGSWHCTDAEVGYRVYFFDDKPVATSFQQGRKWNEEIKWLSKELFNEVKDYILSFIEEKEYSIDLIEDLDAEIAEGYSIGFFEQLYGYHSHNVTYKSKRVKIVDFKKEFATQIDDNPYRRDTVQIEYENGDRELVKLNKLTFLFNIITK